jgi:HD-like signal output (HDOD) protein
VIDGPALTEVITLGKIRLPPAPVAGLRIRRRLGEPGCTLEALAEIASVDPALAAAVLSLANSGEYASLSPVSSVDDAVQRIGIHELTRVAFAVTGAGAAATPGPLYTLRLLAWRRSLTCAVLCRFIAERRGYPSDDAFACGLLHDFGWIVAFSAVEDLLAASPEEGGRPAEAWMALVDQFHILLGHIAATRWNLSPMIAEVILCHHEPAQASPVHRPMVALVWACDRLVTLLEERPSVSEADIAAIPGFQGDLAREIAESLPGIVAAAGRLLELSPEAPPAPSKVARPRQTLLGKIKKVRWEMTWLRHSGPVAGVVTGVTADGLVAILPEAPPENYILKVSIAAGGRPLELFVTPVQVDPEGDEQRVEARLFALTGGPRTAWDQMYRTAE